MPLVSRTFDQLIDFTRTSAATYVDASGRIVPTPASRNLLTFTQEFDNAAWNPSGLVTANAATAPDGTLTADRLNINATQAAISQTVAGITAGSTYTFSVWARAASSGGASKLRITTNNTSAWNTGITQSYDLTTSWQRITLTGSVISSGTSVRVLIGAVNIGGADDSAVRGMVDIWGAQLEAVPDANLVLGSELVTNGGFDTDTWWSKDATVTISGGVANFTNTPASSGVFRSSFAEVGKAYRVTYTVSSISSGTIRVLLGTGASALRSATGTYTDTIVCAGTGTLYIQAFSGSNTNATVDNISVKEITGTTGMPTDYTRNNGGVYPPRFDYDPVTLAPKGLLVEEQRTNLLTYSEQFDNAVWIKGGVTVSANTTTSPDGTVDADKLVEDTANSGHGVTLSYTVVSATTYALSFYAKAAGRSRISFSGGGFASQGFNAIFDVSNGTMVLNNGDKATITSVGNGWYRCTVAFTTSSTVAFGLAMADNSNNTTYTGDGTSGIFIWGAQLEAGSFATSYIPTVASQVTRTADVATITGANFSQWYNQSEGTFVVEASCFGLGKSLSDGFVAATNGTAAENISIYRTSSANNVQSSIRDNNTDQATYTVALGTQPVKAALAYATNNSNSAQGGVAQTTDTTCTIPTVDRLLIGSIYAAGDYPTNGHIRSIRYYPTRLSNAQLQALTA